MKIEIELAFPEKVNRLYLELDRMSDSINFESNSFIITNDDGMQLRITTALNYVSFGGAGDEWDDGYWTENLSSDEISLRITMFQHRHYENLRKRKWSCAPAGRGDAE
jgi:hypothetical protein